jgi:hypothetical protein
MSHDSGTFLEAHPRITLTLIVTVGIIGALVIAEMVLRLFLGLGDPLLYQSSPLFGYRLQAHQLVERRDGARIRVNNLGLRAEDDWDDRRENKILFLGNSVTFGGTFLSNIDLFSHLAVGQLEDYSAGNGGVNGWGIENMHALVVDYGFLPASVYVTVLQDMDFERGLSKFAGQPFWTRKPRFALEEAFFFFVYRWMLGMYEGHDRFVTEKEREKAIERSVVKLRELDEFLRGQGFIHLIYMSTDKFQLLGESAPDSLVRALLRRYNVPVKFIGDQPEVRSLSPEEIAALFYDWNHLDKPGHALWGRIIGQDLRKLLDKKEQEE